MKSTHKKPVDGYTLSAITIIAVICVSAFGETLQYFFTGVDTIALIESSRVNLTGVLFANGGNADPGTIRLHGAGGGGGGRIKIFYDESNDDTSTKTVAGGPGSPGGPPPPPPDCPGNNGATGTIHTGTFISLEPTTTVGPEI